MEWEDLSAIEVDDINSRSRPMFSICTLVTRQEQYRQMLQSFRRAGFGADCEFIYIDNSAANKYDGYSGLNFFLRNARGKYTIVCHQDVLLDFDDRSVLEARIDELCALDPYWGVCGNAGLTATDRQAVRITDPNAIDGNWGGPFPVEVTGLDENFIVVNGRWNLSVSPRLTGFHLYATELCAAAHNLGLNAYVIDFHLRHLSGGSMTGFHESLRALQEAHVLRCPRLAGNTCGATFLGAPRQFNLIANRLLRSRFRATTRAILVYLFTKESSHRKR